MIAIIGKDCKVFSLPLGPQHIEGYDVLVKRVCQVKYKKRKWTGFLVVPEHVLTVGFFPHGREFDVEFYGKEPTSGFITEDWGEVIELGVGKIPMGLLYAQHAPVLPGQPLYIIGSILGIPYTLATCRVEKILITTHVMTAERLSLLDEYSSGSPVFNSDGALVGILEAYIEKTDKMVIRSLVSNKEGLLKG